MDLAEESKEFKLSNYWSLNILSRKPQQGFYQVETSINILEDLPDRIELKACGFLELDVERIRFSKSFKLDYFRITI